jgi:hypothetical protein
MPWYIPIITALIGVIGGWLVRAHFDKKADRNVSKREESKSRESLRREIFKDYMAMTDGGEYGPYALQRCGALRLTKEEFHGLLNDISRTGRHPIEDDRDHDFIGSFGLFETLLLVSSQKIEARSEMVIYHALVDAISHIDPPTSKLSAEEDQPQ